MRRNRVQSTEIEREQIPEDTVQNLQQITNVSNYCNVHEKKSKFPLYLETFSDSQGTFGCLQEHSKNSGACLHDTLGAMDSGVLNSCSLGFPSHPSELSINIKDSSKQGSSFSPQRLAANLWHN